MFNVILITHQHESFSLHCMMFRKYPKSSLCIYKYYISALSPSFTLHCRFLSSSHLLYFFTFLCPHFTSSSLSFFTGVAPSWPGGQGGIWLAPTGMFLCGCCWASRQTKVCVCVFDVFSDPVTRSTYDSLPGHSIPRGHSHTDTERNRKAHQLHLPLTFLLIEFLMCFFFLFCF